MFTIHPIPTIHVLYAGPVLQSLRRAGEPLMYLKHIPLPLCVLFAGYFSSYFLITDHWKVVGGR